MGARWGVAVGVGAAISVGMGLGIVIAAVTGIRPTMSDVAVSSSVPTATVPISSEFPMLSRLKSS